MKYVKILGLAAVAAMALMAFAAGTASATTLYSGATVLGAGETIEASLSGSAKLKDTNGNTLDTCTAGTVSGKTSNTTGTWIEGAATVTWGTKTTPCTSTTDTIKGGTLDIMWTSGLNGEVVSTGAEVTVETLGTSCIYGTATTGTKLGTLVGSTTGNATLAISATVEEKEPKKFICPDTTIWEANYTVTSPSPLHVTS